jgi:hypothetical protein
MSIALFFLLLWLIAVIANLFSWMRALSWEAQPPPRFFHRPPFLSDRVLRPVAATVLVLLVIAYLLKPRDPSVSQILFQLPSWIMMVGLTLLCCYSIWRRHNTV